MKKDDNKFINPILGYNTYFDYLIVIWTRFVGEFEQYDACRKAEDELRPKSPGVHKWSAKEKRLYELDRLLLRELQLFMRVLSYL